MCSKEWTGVQDALTNRPFLELRPPTRNKIIKNLEYHCFVVLDLKTLGEKTPSILVIRAHTACQHQTPVDIIETSVKHPWFFSVFPNKGAIGRQRVRGLYHANVLADDI